MTLDANGIIQGSIVALVAFVGGLAWRTYERVGEVERKVSRMDVTLHGEGGQNGMAARVKDLGVRSHDHANDITGHTGDVNSLWN